MPIRNPNSYPGTPGTTLYAGLPTPPSSGGLLTTFSLDNWDAVSSTRTLFRGGMPFKKGDVPAGSVPEIRRAGGAPVVAQFDERSTWSDGSLKFCVCHMRDTNLAASGTQAYEVHSVTGSFNNTGATTLASVAASDALTVEISSFTQFNNTTNVTRASGAALGSFAAHAAVATRVTKVHSGPVCEGWQVWGMVKDGAAGAGAEDAHLKCIWYVDVWKDAGGAVIDTEFAVEMAQDWWAVADKFRLDYTATLKRNGTTVQAYTGIQHPYRAHWLTARMTNDFNHGKRHWVGSVPALTRRFSKTYWRDTHQVPPFADIVTGSNTSITLLPLSSQQHRADVNGTGAYMGRGLLPNNDAVTFMNQTPVDYRASRVNGFAGLHVPNHFKDERTRTRSGESADIANTLIPALWDPKPSSASTFVGLPAPAHSYASGPETRGYVVNLGGFVYGFTGNGDGSHAVPYSTSAYLFEGERYFLEAMISAAMTLSTGQFGNEFGGKPWPHWYLNVAARTEMSIPNVRWSGIPGFNAGERDVGWGVNLLSNAAALTPDNDPQGQYLKAWNSHCGEYLQACADYTPPSLAAAGVPYNTVGNTNGSMHSPWQAGFVVQGCAMNYLANEVTGYKNYANMAVRSLASKVRRHFYETDLYRAVLATTTVAYSGGNYLSANEYLAGPYPATVTANVVSMAFSGTANPGIAANGDVAYFYPRNDGGASTPVPVGYTEGTTLYVVNVSGATYGLSLTPGGSPISIPDGSYQVAGKFTGRAAVNPAVFPPYLPNSDDYPSILEATFVLSERAALSSVTPGTSATVRSFLTNVARHAAWALSP